MKPNELNRVVELHRKWLDGTAGGQRADLTNANLTGANLTNADLTNADLWGAKLRGANLTKANLTKANLTNADLAGAKLPAPPVVLLACWGELSRALTRALMRYDAANHPNPKAFDEWANGGCCPYDGLKIQRAAQFRERREWWSPGPAKSAYQLMVRVIREKCADSDYHVKKGKK